MVAPRRVVVLAGAGHAHVEVLRRFAMKPEPGIAFLLVTPRPLALYSGMLPGLVAGLYRVEEAHVDAHGLAAAAGAMFVEQAVVGLDANARRVQCADGRSIGYDILSLDIGIAPMTVPGADDHTIAVKPIGGFLDRFDDLVPRVRAGGASRIAIVGGGAGGVELALAVAHRLRAEAATAGRDPASIHIHLLARASRLVPDLPQGVARRLARHLARQGVAVLCGAYVTAVRQDHLRIHGRPPLPVDAVLWATQAAAPAWLRGTALPLDPAGFVIVEAGLDVRGRPDIFAAGDVVRFAPRDLPKAGVHAVRQGPVLADNLRRRLRGLPLRPYRPQREALVLVSTGGRHAVGTRNGLVVEGDWVWRWKDWLDRRWTGRYRNL